MKKGISPIVAIVLLIAIAVIAAVGIYFWVEGLATKQPTPEKPVAIVANPVGNGKVLIANLGQRSINTSTLRTSDPNLKISCESNIIKPDEQVLCTIIGTPSSSTIAIWGNGTGSTTVPINNQRVDNPPVIEWVKDNSTNGEMLLGDSLNIQAKAVDDVGISDVTLHANNPSGSFNMTNIEDDIYSKDITPTSKDDLNYYITVNDTSNQTTTSNTYSVDVVDNWFIVETAPGNDLGMIVPDAIMDGDNIVMTGNTSDNNVYLVKIGPDNSTELAELYNTTGNDTATAVLNRPNGYIIVGTTDVTGAKGILVLEVNKTDGSIIWAESINVTSLDKVLGASSLSNGFVILGDYYAGSTGYDAFAINLDDSGNILAAKAYSAGDSTDELFSAVGTDSGYLLVGGTYSAGGGSEDGWVINTDSNWNNTWSETYGNASDSNSAERFRKIIPDGSGNWIAVGSSGNMAWLLKLDPSGSVLATKKYTDTYTTSIFNILTLNSGYLLLGWDQSYSSGKTAYYSWQASVKGDFSLVNSTVYYSGETDGSGQLIGAGAVSNNLFLVSIGGTVIKTDRYGRLASNCSYWKDVTQNITLVDGPGATGSVSVSNSTLSSVSTDITANTTASSMSPTQTCICQPFGC